MLQNIPMSEWHNKIGLEVIAKIFLTVKEPTCGNLI